MSSHNSAIHLNTLNTRDEHYTLLQACNMFLLYVLCVHNGGSCTVRNFIVCAHPQISLGKSSQGE
jgi:hypothetical protein